MPVGKFLRMYFSAFSLCDASIRPVVDLCDQRFEFDAVEQVDQVKHIAPDLLILLPSASRITIALM